MAREFVGASTQYLTGDFVASAGTGNITVGVWYYVASVIGFTALACIGGDDGSCLILNVGTANFGAFVSGSGSANFESGVAPTTGTWKFVALRVTSGACRIVHHGVENGTGATVTGRTAPTQQTTVGGRRNIANSSGSQYWTGRLSDLCIWDRAVPDAELLDMATGLKSPLWYQTNLVYYNRIVGTSADPEPPTIGSGSLTTTGATFVAGPGLSDSPSPAAGATERIRVFINSVDRTTSTRS